MEINNVFNWLHLYYYFAYMYTMYRTNIFSWNFQYFRHKSCILRNWCFIEDTANVIPMFLYHIKKQLKEKKKWKCVTLGNRKGQSVSGDSTI